MEDLPRFFSLEQRLLERLSTRIEPFAHGVAFFDEEYRGRFNSNFLLADGLLADVPAEALIEEADRILGRAGYAHRSVVVRDDRQGERLAPAFAEHGYAVERNVTMVHARAPDRRSALEADEVSFAEVRPLLLEIYLNEPFTTSEEEVRAFTDQHGKYERVIGARFFTVRLDGELAGDCELYVDGLDAQVEHVDTLEAFRGRGVARAVVLAAIDAAREAGVEHIFIVADDDDWPKELYAKLGFDRIGRTWQFTISPEATA